jgi:hypothetical protein
VRLRRTFHVDWIPAWKRPWWYGIAYWEWDKTTAVGYPLGLHWIARIYRRFNPTPEQRAIEAWLRGSGPGDANGRAAFRKVE